MFVYIYIYIYIYIYENVSELIWYSGRGPREGIRDNANALKSRHCNDDGRHEVILKQLKHFYFFFATHFAGINRRVRHLAAKRRHTERHLAVIGAY